MVRESGQVNRISVAVLVDGTYDAEGNYAPRPAAEIENYITLVKSAIGFNEERGDVVQVVNQQFAAPVIGDDLPVEAGLLGFNKGDLFRLAEMLVLGIVSVLVLLLVVRPLLSRAFDAAATATAASETAAMLPAGGEQMRLAPPSGDYEALEAGSELEAMPREVDDEDDPEIDIAQVDGKVKKSSLSQINQIVEKHPDETISIMRGWMYQDA